MLIAQKLKKENIIEYLLYMWQIEDLIRACNLSIDIVNEKIIQPQQIPDKEKKTMHEWYENLINMMKFENVQEKGHLQLNKNIILELNELHSNLLSSGKDAAYPAKFYHVLPFIIQLKQQQPDSAISEIEVCFNFLYGILLLRMKGTEISNDTLHAQEEISKFMVLLAKNYNLSKSGKLEFD